VAAIRLLGLGDRLGHLLPGAQRTGTPRVLPKVDDPTPFAGCLHDADVYDQAPKPGVESVRIAEPSQVSPGDHQRVLQGVLGSIDIAEDPLRDREEAVGA